MIVASADHALALVRRLGWASVAVTATLLVQSLVHHPIGPTPILIAAGLAVLTAIRPFDGLLSLAALGPLSAMLLALVASHPSAVRFHEALVLAFLGGYAARSMVRSEPLAVAPWVGWSVKVLIAGALASAVVGVALLHAEDPEKTVSDLLSVMVVRDYLNISTPLSVALQFAEGLLLLLVASDTCAGELHRRETALRMMVLGAAAAALLNVMRIITAAVGQPDPWPAFLHYLVQLRVNVHFADLNAAGSYFALTLFIAAGLAPRARIVTAIAAPLIATALWLTGSRIALGAVLLTATAVVIVKLLSRSSHRMVHILAVLMVVGAVAVGLWKWYPTDRNAKVSDAFAFRVEMGRAGLQLTATNPWFGVGLGSFQRLSGRYALTPENAHNNYIQIMAELGIPGLTLFMATICFALRETYRGISPWEHSWGLIAGLAAFLLTALAGHPLLIPDCAYPFWMAVGLAAASASQFAPLRAPRLAGLFLVAMIVVTLPLRVIEAPQLAEVENTSIGFSASWQKRPDGVRYRWAGGRAAFFVPTSARAVRIPLRLGNERPETIELRIFIQGRQIDAVLLTAADDWRTVRFLLPRVTARYARIDLEARLPGAAAPLDADATDTSGVLMVGRPMIDF